MAEPCDPTYSQTLQLSVAELRLLDYALCFFAANLASEDADDLEPNAADSYTTVFDRTVALLERIDHPWETRHDG